MKVVAVLLMSLGLAMAMTVPSVDRIELRSVGGAGNNIKSVDNMVNPSVDGIDEREKRAFEKIFEREIGGVEARGVELPASFNSTQCVYTPESKMFRCRGVSHDSVVECPAIFEWEGVNSFSLFGLGFAEAGRYFLYPRSLDNSTYLNHTLLTEGGVRDLFLYFGDKMVEFGFRVTDLSCFERIVKLISVAPVVHIGELESELVVKPSVSLIGEVLLVDSQVTKRWLGGWGLGMGMGLWGMGGFGLGGWGFGGLGLGGLGLWGR